MKLKGSSAKDLAWKLENTGSYPGFNNVFIGHLRANLAPDIVVTLATTACGLAASRGDIVIFLSDERGYKAYHVVCWNFSSYNFIQYPGEGICLLQTAFVEGEKGLDGRPHNYWVHRLLKVEDASFAEVPSFGRRWIMYSYAPNHSETRQLSDEQKARLWNIAAKELIVETLHPAD